MNVFVCVFFGFYATILCVYMCVYVHCVHVCMCVYVCFFFLSLFFSSLT